ncbi:DUF2784 domain-containing protein [Polaromonas sp.]|uniref:DUF2784 domain-containing protein n=1 Tax=Polaromonas sp. TaxID=1869339 RepID=UPI0017E3BE59|nr:DUF2784 domain-containing protein [Polaromonas sp.]NMM06090.1 DUF2784 domain-containing protein [Polaromonas sp.]
MGYRILADALVLVHAGFILFAVFGGLLALHHSAWMWLHLPAVAWAALVVIMGWTCPLTPWEKSLRAAAGQDGYAGDFIEHYLLSVIYPEGLTRTLQIWLGVGVLVLNLVVYAFVLKRAATGG